MSSGNNWSRVQSSFGNNGSSAGTSAQSNGLTPTLANDMLIFAIVLATAGVVTPPDTTWSLIASLNITGGGSISIFQKNNVIAGLTSSGSFTFASSLAAWCTIEYSGGQNISLTVDQILSINNANGTVVSSGNTNQLSQMNELALCIVGATVPTAGPSLAVTSVAYTNFGNSQGSAATNNSKIWASDVLSIASLITAFTGTLSATPTTGPALIIVTFIAEWNNNGGVGPAAMLG